MFIRFGQFLKMIFTFIFYIEKRERKFLSINSEYAYKLLNIFVRMLLKVK